MGKKVDHGPRKKIHDKRGDKIKIGDEKSDQIESIF